MTDIKNHIGSNKNPSPKPSPDGRGLNKRILIGKVTSAHGIKGDVKVLCYASDSDLLFNEDGVFTDEKSDQRITLIRKSEPKANLFIVNIKGTTDRNKAETLRGLSFYIDRDALPELEDGIYHSDIEGMDVVSNEGKAMGKVIRVQNFGAGDLLEIQGKKESYYLPFAAPYLVSVDTDAKRIIMNPPEVMDAR